MLSLISTFFIALTTSRSHFTLIFVHPISLLTIEDLTVLAKPQACLMTLACILSNALSLVSCLFLIVPRPYTTAVSNSWDAIYTNFTIGRAAVFWQAFLRVCSSLCAFFMAVSQEISLLSCILYYTPRYLYSDRYGTLGFIGYKSPKSPNSSDAFHLGMLQQYDFLGFASSPKWARPSSMA